MSLPVDTHLVNTQNYQTSKFLPVVVLICNSLITKEIEHLFNMLLDYLDFPFCDMAMQVLFFC